MGSASSTVDSDIPVRPSLKSKVSTIMTFKRIGKACEEKRAVEAIEASKARRNSEERRAELMGFISSRKKEKDEAWDSLNTSESDASKPKISEASQSSQSEEFVSQHDCFLISLRVFF